MSDEPVYRSKLTYNYLLAYYLKSQLEGDMGKFNKTYFPDSFKRFMDELHTLEESNKLTTNQTDR